MGEPAEPAGRVASCPGPGGHPAALLPVEGECRPARKAAPGARSQSRRKAMECLGGRPPEAPRAVPHLPSHSAGLAGITFKVCAPSIKSSKKVLHSPSKPKNKLLHAILGIHQQGYDIVHPFSHPSS